MSRYRMPQFTPTPVKDESPAVDKHPHVPAARVQQDYSNTVKEMVRMYNSMRAKLMEAGLMQDKE